MLFADTLDNVQYMKKLFSDYWKQKKFDTKNIIFPNMIGTTPTDNTTFAIFNVIHTGADRCALTGVSHARFRQQGYLSIQLLFPANKGMKNNYEIVQEVLNVYRRPPHDCPINFSDFSFRESDIRYKDFYKVTVTIHFDYDYLL